MKVSEIIWMGLWVWMSGTALQPYPDLGNITCALHFSASLFPQNEMKSWLRLGFITPFIHVCKYSASLLVTGISRQTKYQRYLQLQKVCQREVNCSPSSLITKKENTGVKATHNAKRISSYAQGLYNHHQKAILQLLSNALAYLHWMLIQAFPAFFAPSYAYCGIQIL